MDKCIVSEMIAIMMIAPNVLRQIYRRYSRTRSISAAVSNPFACPNGNKSDFCSRSNDF